MLRPSAGRKERKESLPLPLAVTTRTASWQFCRPNATVIGHKIFSLEITRDVDKANQDRDLHQGTDDGGEGYP